MSLKLCRRHKIIVSFLLWTLFGNAHNLCTCWLPDSESGPNCDHDSLSFFEAAKWMLCPANNENRFNCIAFLNHTVHWAQSQPTGRGWNYWKLDATLNRFCSGCLVLPINTDLNALHFFNYAAHWVFIQPTGRRGGETMENWMQHSTGSVLPKYQSCCCSAAKAFVERSKQANKCEANQVPSAQQQSCKISGIFRIYPCD